MSDGLHVRLRYFASIREALGRDREPRHTRSRTVGALRDELIARGDGLDHCLARHRAVRVALDQQMAGEDTPPRMGCAVAFFSPMTGG